MRSSELEAGLCRVYFLTLTRLIMRSKGFKNFGHQAPIIKLSPKASVKNLWIVFLRPRPRPHQNYIGLKQVELVLSTLQLLLSHRESKTNKSFSLKRRSRSWTEGSHFKSKNRLSRLRNISTSLVQLLLKRISAAGQSLEIKTKDVRYRYRYNYRYRYQYRYRISLESWTQVQQVKNDKKFFGSISTCVGCIFRRRSTCVGHLHYTSISRRLFSILSTCL